MAPQGRTDPAPVSRLLKEEPGRFEFFQAVRLLQQLDAGRSPVGRDGDPRRESVRFRSSVSLGYPPVELTGIDEEGGQDFPPEMTVAFMGVASPLSFGSLPLRYTEHILDQQRDDNFALRDFLDLFNHRFISMFYRAWEKNNLPVSHEREETGVIEKALFSLIGMGLSTLTRRLPFPDLALLSRAGLLARRPLPAGALENLIVSYLKVPVEVVQFVPRWYEVAEEEVTRLGVANTTLGEDFLVGDSVHLYQFGFRLRLGPLGREEYMDFLPQGAGFRSLVDLVCLAVGKEFEFDVQLILRAPEVPEFRLTSSSDQRTFLGWSTWLKSRPFEHDPSDAVFDAQVVPPEERE